MKSIILFFFKYIRSLCQGSGTWDPQYISEGSQVKIIIQKNKALIIVDKCLPKKYKTEFSNGK